MAHGLSPLQALGQLLPPRCPRELPDTAAFRRQPAPPRPTQPLGPGAEALRNVGARQRRRSPRPTTRALAPLPGRAFLGQGPAGGGAGRGGGLLWERAPRPGPIRGAAPAARSRAAPWPVSSACLRDFGRVGASRAAD